MRLDDLQPTYTLASKLHSKKLKKGGLIANFNPLERKIGAR
jgi:hypothetical protein